jgi:hypothetical protein
MVERERSTQNSNASWPTSNDVAMFRLGYLQATCDQTKATCNQILAKVVAMQAQPTAPPPPSGPPSPWTTMKDYAKDFVLLTKLWAALRSGPWGILAWLGYGLLKWLGVLS